MAFTDDQIAEYSALIEQLIWSKRRPPHHLRDQIREGQRIEGDTVEIFMNRPAYLQPGEWREHPIAKARFVKAHGVWHIFWLRADSKWHRYGPLPEVKELSQFLIAVQEDEKGCFWG